MVNFGLLTAEICWRVWGTPANFNWFRVFAGLLYGILVVGVSQNLRRWTEGAIYIRQGGHHVGHWPTFLVLYRPFLCQPLKLFTYRPTYAFLLFMVALCNRADHYIFALWFLSFFLLSFFSSPNLSGRRLDVYHTSTQPWCGLSANLECMSEMCCTRLAENTGRNNRHFGTITQLCWAVSSQLRHVSTIGNKTC